MRDENYLQQVTNTLDRLKNTEKELIKDRKKAEIWAQELIN